MTVIVDMIVKILFKILDSAPELIVGKLLDRVGKKDTPLPHHRATLFASECGDKGIDLAHQRLLVSSAFGTYFAALLERDHSYVEIKGQIETPIRRGQEGLDPLQRIYWAVQNPRGPRILVIAAEGGMGKSTLAAKIVRCLYDQRAVDVILGDSAKTQKVDPISGLVVSLDPAYYDPATFRKRLRSQLGLPDKPEEDQRALRDIRDRLEGRRAIIVVDNLETVAQGGELMTSLGFLSTRDTRSIVTTRKISSLRYRAGHLCVVRLKPLEELTDARAFLKWHVQRHADQHPDLWKLEPDIEKRKRLQVLVERTGGIPLLMQLVLSDVARYSWDYMRSLPHLFGEALLDFLYSARWQELGSLGSDGLLAKHLLMWVAREQYKGEKVTFDRLARWAIDSQGAESPQSALRLLHERFLIVNYDLKKGNFALFPSFVEFLQTQQPEVED